MMQATLQSPGKPYPYSSFVVGAWDEEAGIFIQSTATPYQLLDGGAAFIYMDLGYRTSADGSKRLVCAGWMRASSSPPVASGASIVREVTWDAAMHTLISQPVPEVASLRKSVPLSNLTTPLPLAAEDRYTVCSDAPAADAELAFAFSNGTGAVEVQVGALGGLVVFNLSVSQPASVPIGSAEMCRSCRAVSIRRFPDDGSVETAFVLRAGELLTVRILVDTILVELFAGFGRGVASVVAADQHNLHNTTSIFAQASAPGVALQSATVWAMDAI